MGPFNEKFSISVELPQKIQLVIVTEAVEKLKIPPPSCVPEFPEKVQLVMVGLPVTLYIPPPPKDEFPEKEQLVNVGEDVPLLYIPPPSFPAELLGLRGISSLHRQTLQVISTIPVANGIQHHTPLP